MRPSAALFDALASLLEYPRTGHAARTRASAAVVAAEIPEAGADLESFVRLAEEGDLGAAEETYVRTFDVNAERALEVGWQVFGEQYARGAFLVRMREWMRREGVEETAELPDHLTQVLRVLGRVPEEQARLLVGAAVEPALRRVCADLAGQGPYAGVLAAVAKAVAWAGGSAEDAATESVARPRSESRLQPGRSSFDRRGEGPPEGGTTNEPHGDAARRATKSEPHGAAPRHATENEPQGDAPRRATKNEPHGVDAWSTRRDHGAEGDAA